MKTPSSETSQRKSTGSENVQRLAERSKQTWSIYFDSKLMALSYIMDIMKICCIMGVFDNYFTFDYFI